MPKPAGRCWQFWIDRGGTFTDVVARTPDGRLLTHKLLSESPDHYQDAAIEGIHRLLDLPRGQDISGETVEAVKIGTTVATNALLERKGEPTVLMVTRGFRDVLRIGYQNRPRLFDRRIVLPRPLYARVLEVDERLDVHGQVIRPLDPDEVRRQLQSVYDQGLRALAVALLHAYRHPAHERLIGQIAQQIGFEQISLSHQVSALMRFVARADTATVDAYLSPVLHRYVDQVSTRLPGVRLLFMQSNGGLSAATAFHGKDAVLSGPAGGVIGMVRSAQSAGFSRIIGFDMGGTSTDVSHFAGQFERQLETQIGGVRICAPMTSIHTVAAGGGSILHYDQARLRVGPDSAGANPGPAAYRRGGPLTLTDCNVLLGRIQAGYFPRLFGADGSQAIDTRIVRELFAELAARLSRDIGRAASPEQVAESFIEIAVRNMAHAINRVSVERGYDITQYVLNCFGGAGGQHACQVADQLGMRRVLIHPLAGVLSAFGIGLAQMTAMREQTAEIELEAEAMARLEGLFGPIERAVRAQLESQGLPAAGIQVQRSVLLRYDGTDTALPVPYGELTAMRSRFEHDYQQRFSFRSPDRRVIAATLVVEASGAARGDTTDGAVLDARGDVLRPAASVELYADQRWSMVPLYRREQLCSADRIAGPAIVVDSHSTTMVESGWEADVTSQGCLVMSRVRAKAARTAASTDVDPLRLEVFANLFMSIAEQMGLRLQLAAHSVNIKERLDYSCALFDAQGDLIANAPHIPVHLGSMSETVKTVMRANAGSIQPGDAFAVNDPYHGGTHLPDITVITPVFDASGSTIEFYVGSRGHHADVGGTTPGSMPSDSTRLEQEGVLFTNWRLVEGGRLREAETLALLRSGPYPARNPEQNLADLRAQLAANAKGVEELQRASAEFGADVVQAYTRHVQNNAEEAVRRALSTLRDGDFRLELDNGAAVQVSVRVDRAQRCAVIDFSGSSPQLDDSNFNAPASIAVAAVLFVFRSLVDRDIPLNAGCLRPLQIITPHGGMLNPRYPAAVVAGNVETSQCVTNALFGALGLSAASQCTMNNLSFGMRDSQYYETIAGGSGAGDGYDGTDVVHTHMTNSRITDPEVLEYRYPVRVESFEIRAGSGGAGRWHGGNGAVRRIRFLEPAVVSVLSNNRRVAPFGLQGGEAGEPGRNQLQRADGRTQSLGSCATVVVAAGDAIVIETPGGGGFGVRE
jgi:5-oxoprolinase (ATP-hydrolysing)